MPTHTSVHCTTASSWQSWSKCPQSVGQSPQIHLPLLSRKIKVRFLSSLIWIWELHILYQLTTSYPNLWMSDGGITRYVEKNLGRVTPTNRWSPLTLWNSFSDQFPLLTTKRVFWKGVLEELLWFIKVQYLDVSGWCAWEWYQQNELVWNGLRNLGQLQMLLFVRQQKKCNHQIFWLHAEGHYLQDILCILVEAIALLPIRRVLLFLSKEIVWNSEGFWRFDITAPQLQSLVQSLLIVFE